LARHASGLNAAAAFRDWNVITTVLDLLEAYVEEISRAWNKANAPSREEDERGATLPVVYYLGLPFAVRRIAAEVRLRSAYVTPAIVTGRSRASGTTTRSVKRVFCLHDHRKRPENCVEGFLPKWRHRFTA
jgi:hypothetical protein